MPYPGKDRHRHKEAFFMSVVFSILGNCLAFSQDRKASGRMLYYLVHIHDEFDVIIKIALY